MHKTLNTLLTACMARPACTHASAQTEDAKTHPGKPVRIVLPFPHGGGNDIPGRLVVPKLAEQYGQSFLIDNRPGPGGHPGLDSRDLAAWTGDTGYHRNPH